MSRLVMVGALAGAAAACGAGFNAAQYSSPDSLYEASLSRYREGDCGDAIVGLQRLTFELPPRDPRLAEVRYYLAECQLEEGDRLEAARSFRRVADEFPQHELAPNALLHAGDANRDLWRNPELDPTYGDAAMAVYRELLIRYPNSDAAGQGRERISELNEMFAEKEFKTGRFYMRLNAFDSAIIYFKAVVERYPRSSFAPKALMRLAEAYRKIGYVEERREICSHLHQYYPDTPDLAEECPADLTP
jgi:outer membrane protein assembly factor BamD